jgi:hypothetical protein
MNVAWTTGRDSTSTGATTAQPGTSATPRIEPVPTRSPVAEIRRCGHTVSGKSRAPAQVDQMPAWRLAAITCDPLRGEVGPKPVGSSVSVRSIEQGMDQVRQMGPRAEGHFALGRPVRTTAWGCNSHCSEPASFLTMGRDVEPRSSNDQHERSRQLVPICSQILILDRRSSLCSEQEVWALRNLGSLGRPYTQRLGSQRESPQFR